MKEITSDNGFLFADKEKTFFFKSITGININKDDYIQIKKEEANKIISEQKKINEIHDIKDIDNIIDKSKIISKAINNVKMTDNEALARKDYYPKWDDFIDQILKVNYKIQYKNSLYKVKQEHLVQEQFFPSIETASLYEEINETHTGTKEDPIPYNNNMRLELGKFYSHKDIIYECIRDSEVAVYNDLSELIDIYVKLV